MIGTRSFMAKGEEVERKWYIIDAENKPLGRLAVQVARILSGKHKPTYIFQHLPDKPCQYAPDAV